MDPQQRVVLEVGSAASKSRAAEESRVERVETKFKTWSCMFPLNALYLLVTSSLCSVSFCFH